MNFPCIPLPNMSSRDFVFGPLLKMRLYAGEKGYPPSPGTERSLPAALVYISYSPLENETPICHTIFGGIASGTVLYRGSAFPASMRLLSVTP